LIILTNMDTQLEHVVNTINLAIAPSFLLIGVGTQLRLLTNRLARIINRSRAVERSTAIAGEPSGPNGRIELDFLYRRMHLIQRAITLSTCCALLICVAIVALFADDVFDLALDKFIALVFIAGILALVGSFVYFLREIFIATATLLASMRDRLTSG
jgi:hypothetical protein